MMPIDDDLITAFADGELDEVTRARIGRAIAEDPALQARLEVEQRLRARLAAHYAPAVAEPVPERLRALLETNLVDLGTSRRPRPMWQNFAALAATLVLGLALGRTLMMPDGQIGTEGGIMVARSALAEALETQLASAQAPDAAIRIGVTFAGVDGRPCRTFEGASAAGLACRGEAGWQLMMTTAGTGRTPGQFRQAGSGDALVLQAAEAIMAGEPLDSDAERRARDSGWRRSSASR